MLLKWIQDDGREGDWAGARLHGYFGHVRAGLFEETAFELSGAGAEWGRRAQSCTQNSRGHQDLSNLNKYYCKIFYLFILFFKDFIYLFF